MRMFCVLSGEIPKGTFEIVDNSNGLLRVTLQAPSLSGAQLRGFEIPPHTCWNVSSTYTNMETRNSCCYMEPPSEITANDTCERQPAMVSRSISSIIVLSRKQQKVYPVSIHSI